MTELQTLKVESTIGENSIVGDIPSSIVKLTKLVKIGLLNTGINGQLPIALGEMTSLKSLIVTSVTGSFLNGLIPESICLLDSLEELILKNNALTGLLTLF